MTSLQDAFIAQAVATTSLGTFGECIKKKSWYKNKFKEDKNMEIKSRYEVISELEGQKRTLIREREGFKDRIKNQKKDIRDSERELEDAKEELKDFEGTVTERQSTIKELIKSIDESLQRFSKLDAKKS